MRQFIAIFLCHVAISNCQYSADGVFGHLDGMVTKLWFILWIFCLIDSKYLMITYFRTTYWLLCFSIYLSRCKLQSLHYWWRTSISLVCHRIKWWWKHEKMAKLWPKLLWLGVILTATEYFFNWSAILFCIQFSDSSPYGISDYTPQIPLNQGSIHTNIYDDMYIFQYLLKKYSVIGF